MATKTRRKRKHIKLEGKSSVGEGGGRGETAGDEWRMNLIQTHHMHVRILTKSILI